MSLTNVRIALKPPRANGLGGAWTATCDFAGRRWRFRFYSREWIFQNDGDDDAWRELEPEQRETLRASILDALEAAQAKRQRRAMEESRFRSAMRFQVGLGLRDQQLSRHRSAPATAPATVRRGAPRSRRRNVRTRPSSARAPGEPSEPPPPDLAQLAAASARCWAHVKRREARL